MQIPIAGRGKPVCELSVVEGGILHVRIEDDAKPELWYEMYLSPEQIKQAMDEYQAEELAEVGGGR